MIFITTYYFSYLADKTTLENSERIIEVYRRNFFFSTFTGFFFKKNLKKFINLENSFRIFFHLKKENKILFSLLFCPEKKKKFNI